MLIFKICEKYNGGKIIKPVSGSLFFKSKWHKNLMP